jgi:hypothetical protein
LIAPALLYSEYFKGRKHVDNLGAMAMARFNGSQGTEARGVKTGLMWIKIVTGGSLL